MDNDTRIVKAVLAAGVLQVLTNPGAPDLKSKDARGPVLKQIADVTEELFNALFRVN